MLIPGVILTVMFCYVPMAGLVMAFDKYAPVEGILHSRWVGLANFRYLLSLPDTMQVLFNTVYIAFMKIISFMVLPVIFALLLNEVTRSGFKKPIQTIIYTPHFLSWIILGGVLIDILSPSEGLVNLAIKAMGLKPIFFLGDPKWFPYVMVITNIWKEFGFEAIIYLAALTSIDPSLYEAAVIDGAGRWKQTLHITLPGILPIIIMMMTLNMGDILNAGFDQIFNLYNPAVYQTGDIIDTFIYRMGIIDAQYSVATAVGFFKSIVSLVFVAGSFKMAERFSGYRVL